MGSLGRAYTKACSGVKFANSFGARRVAFPTSPDKKEDALRLVVSASEKEMS